MSQQHNSTPPRRNFLKKTLALIPLAAGSNILALDAKAATLKPVRGPDNWLLSCSHCPSRLSLV